MSTLVIHFVIGLAILSINLGAIAAEFNYLVISKYARPLQIEDQGQNHRGIITELVQEIFKGSVHTLNIHTYPFKRMIRNINQGMHPNWINYGTPAWGEPQGSNLSQVPILSIKHVFVTAQDSAFQFSSVEDLFGQRIILLLGFDYQGLDQYLEQDKIASQRVQSFEAAFGMLARKDRATVGFVDMEIRAKYNLASMGLAAKNYRLSDFSSTIANFELSLSMDPNMEPALSHFINQRLQQLIDEGFVEHLSNKYQ